VTVSGGTPSALRWFSETPTSRASACQCRGCGTRLPACEYPRNTARSPQELNVFGTSRRWRALVALFSRTRQRSANWTGPRVSNLGSLACASAAWPNASRGTPGATLPCAPHRSLHGSRSRHSRHKVVDACLSEFAFRSRNRVGQVLEHPLLEMMDGLSLLDDAAGLAV